MIKAINHVWKLYRSIAMDGAIVFLVVMSIASTISLAISPGITVLSGQPDVFIDLDNDGVWDEDTEPSFYGPDAIQRAIIAAHDGNTIRVNKNETTDYSRIVIYKAVRIVGNASNKPIIDGSLCKTSNMVAVHVKSSDVILDNFIIHDSSIGVLVHRLFGLSISNITISNCTIYDIKGIFGWTPPAYCPKGCAIALVGDVTSSIIRNNVIYDCEKGIFLSGGADNNSIISNEVYDADIGILLNAARDNIIMWNSIHHNEIGIKIFKNNTIHCNDIFENEKYGIKVPSCPLAEPVDAKYNWWGSSSGPYDDHDTDSAPPPYNNMDGTGDRVTAYVYYRPWERIVTNISFDGPVSTENGYPLIGGSTKINLAAATTCPCCWVVNATYYRVWWNGSWNPAPGSGVDDTGNFKLYTGNFTLSGDGLHYLEFYSEDSGGHKEEVKNVTVDVDDTPPQIIKTVGYPHVQGDGYPDYWITSSTNITINATEQGYSNSDLEKVSYRIYCNGTWSSWTDITTELPYTLKFSEECNHTLQIVAKDCLGNTAWDNETFYVDNTPPDISKEFSGPYYEKGDDIFITSDTKIWVNATDTGTEPCIVGSVNLTVDVYNAITRERIDHYTTEVEDGTASIGPFTISEECEHWINITAVDGLGNTAYHNETVYVDNTPPEFNKEIGKPHYVKDGKNFITSETPIYFNITDGGTEPCIVGSLHVRVGIWYNGEWNYTWYNQSDSPMNLTIYLENNCTHYLNVTMYDDLGNMVYDNETIYVDNIPPVINKTVGEPSMQDDNGTWWVTTETQINVAAYDQGCSSCGEVTIQYRIWFLGNWTEWMNYTGSITFSEYTMYYLEIRAFDCLGNMALDNETFIVSPENNPPYKPTNPSPADGATDVEIDITLSWQCSDPDGDSLTYDVYFGTSSNPPKVSSNQSATTYKPSTLNYSTTYYWKIVAWDEHGEKNEGDVWTFTTKSKPSSGGGGTGGGTGGGGTGGSTGGGATGGTTGGGASTGGSAEETPPNNPPVADPDGPYYGIAGTVITFNASGSYDPENSTIEYRWDFNGDGAWDTEWLTTPYTEYTYQVAGNYTVILEVKDVLNATSSAQTTAIIAESFNYPPNEPSIDGPSSGYVNESYNFTIVATDNDGDAIKYFINWGDGTTTETDFLPNGTSIKLDHSWSQPGNYTISVKAYDNNTYSGEVKWNVSVKSKTTTKEEDLTIYYLLTSILLVLLVILILLAAAKRKKKEEEKKKKEAVAKSKGKKKKQ